MVKVAPRQAEHLLRAPDPALRAVLLYGPDEGLVRERAAALVRTVAADPSDPFRVVDLDPATLRADPARLVDEAASLSMIGGRRVVRLRRADDALSQTFREFLAQPPGPALVVIEAGDLPARSALRKVIEAAADAAALGCYRDDARTLTAVIRAALRAEGLDAAPDALDWLSNQLGGDRQVTRRELDKLVLYKGGAGGRVELAEAQACVGDSVALTLEDMAFAVAGGDPAAALRAWQRSLQAGVQPVTALRTVARHFQRLHLVAGKAARGAPVSEAMQGLRPRVFWKMTAAFEAQVRRWPRRALGDVLIALLEAERACKQTGQPDVAICGHTLLEIAHRTSRAVGHTAARH